ncbi:MAG: carbamoyltransferase HypF, partial [Actinomycetota bacterium]|nr:carbamoyltransferase HypF [Actinomycetota bacterium]
LCDAASDAAVAKLRRRKAREEKPLAVMVPGLEWAARLVHLTPDEAEVMGSWRRPIVLARCRRDAPIAPAVAPGNRYLGVMLSYTPLHQLLLEDFARPVVATSGNLSDEPIAYRDEDGLERLGRIADAFLTHDRAIHMRCDDSVVRVFEGAEYPIRRARGYAPEPLLMSQSFERPVLGVGAELKHTFCLGIGSRAVLSHHIGDLESYEAMTSFVEGLEHFKRIYGITPEVAAHDLHPDYLSTKWVESLGGVERIGVQHHHAHVASCLADNGRDDRVIGMALDGTGYGSDGTLWGFEVLAADLEDFERLFKLRPMPLPGGAMAISEPWRLAVVYLDAAFGDSARALDLDFVRTTAEHWGPILQMAKRSINAPLASSAGRLFDAAAALCGVRLRSAFEGQAAQELEQLADPSVADAYDCSIAGGEVDGVELVTAMALDLIAGRPRSEVAAAFHNGVAQALARAAELAGAATGLRTVALSGGTWQNLLLLERTIVALQGAGFEVLRHRRVPCNDGGISLGQAVVADARVRSGGLL